MQIIRFIDTDIKRNGQGDREQGGQRDWENMEGLDSSESTYGIALDIGTTTVEMALCSLDQKKKLNMQCERNVQSIMGTDVMMRLMHCQNGMQEKLEGLIRQQVCDMAERLCDGICRTKDIRKMTVAGNTTMCHIFLGQETSGLAGSPFVPAYQGSFLCKGEEIGLESLAKAKVHVLPGIAAHVGSDATAMATALGLGEKEGITLAVDIGTNAEIVLSDRGKIIACSTAAGPAFEGASISRGMRGEPGAIAEVRIAAGTGNLILDVLGYGNKKERERKEVPPVRGICGSGLVDSVAELLHNGVILPDGYLLEKEQAKEQKIPEYLAERIQPDGFVLYQNEVSTSSKDVLITREDIRRFQLAKAAVQSGIHLLMTAAGRKMDELDRIYIAGTFGGNLSKRNAIRIGLLPRIEAEKLVVVQNAALQGACAALFSESFREKIEKFAKAASHLELAEVEGFQEEYLRCMRLGME